MIEAVIFDLDGLLIDSEPFWQETEYNIFKQLGVSITKEMRKKTYGLPINELIDYYYQISPWENFNPELIRNNIFNSVQKKIQNNGVELPGARKTLEFFKNKKFKIGLASGSPYKIINAALSKLKIQDFFSVIHSGEEEIYGKPHPSVYISAANKLAVKPANCLVFEDSLYGLIAAKAALMKVIAVPGNGENNNPKFLLADIKLASLEEFTEKQFDLLNAFN